MASQRQTFYTLINRSLHIFLLANIVNFQYHPWLVFIIRTVWAFGGIIIYF